MDQIRYELLLGSGSAVGYQDVAAFNCLLKQLSSRANMVDKKSIARLLCNGAMIVARDPVRGQIIGMGAIIYGYKLTGYFASIEDVVVDLSFRRRGVGERITRELLKLAQEKGVRYVDLTSNPQRVEANKLYLKIGFRVRQTNPYRMELQTVDAGQQPSTEDLQLGGTP